MVSPKEFKQTNCKVDYALTFYTLRINHLISLKEFKQIKCEAEDAYMFYMLLSDTGHAAFVRCCIANTFL